MQCTSTTIYTIGVSTKNTKFMDCQETCKSDPDCVAGFWDLTEMIIQHMWWMCIIYSINTDYKSDCGTACIAFEKKVNNILCSCTDGADKVLLYYKIQII